MLELEIGDTEESTVPAVTTMAALIGCIESFDIQSENWHEYVERLEQYFVANGIDTEAKKKGTLITVIGGEAYKLLRSLTEP